MDNLVELEKILDNIVFLSDTFLALELAMQNNSCVIPANALTVPNEMLKEYSKSACRLCGELITSGAS